jgi:hypothetical protein
MIRINFPNDCSVHHPAMRAWRAAIDRANADLAAAMNWRLAVNFTEMTFTAVPVESNVVMFRRTHAFLHPLGDGPRAA